MSKKNIILSLMIAGLLVILSFGFFKGRVSAPSGVEQDNKKEIAGMNNSEGGEKIEARENPAVVGNNEIIYYYGAECPHCHDVLKFLDDNKISEKVNFTKKEVWGDKNNASEMMEKVKECGLDESRVGVPFLYAEGKCLIGTPDVEGFFREKAGI